MRALLLVAASTLLGLVASEAGLRLFTRYGHSAGESVTAPVSDHPVDPREAMRYVAQLAAEPGTDRLWFTEDPPPLPNRKPVSTERAERYRDYERRGLFGPQSDYIWNRHYLENTRCSPASWFQSYPDRALAFDPPDKSTHPIYRFPPDTTTAGGLVTNQFGFRGPPLSLAKPPKTIRVAFLGASTTVGFHHFPFSYPERVVYWLNRFAESSHLDAHFEALNAGREGINSEDIPAIVQEEVLPLDPDLAVYYEGSNQFPSANTMVSPHVAARPAIGQKDPISSHVVPEPIRTRLAIGDLVDRALNGFSAVGEPRKPAYRLRWPPGVNQENPDVDSPNLPLQLPVIVKDLDSIRNNLKSVGAQFVLSSFEWYANEGVVLSPTRHQFIYQQLNTVLWPLRYSDIRLLADFQNRVFQRYAAARSIPFLDVASRIPQDPNLFVDAIHMTDTGDRLRAWIAFQQLVPIVRRKIDSGELPRPAGTQLPPPPSLAAREISTRCEDPTGPFTKIDGVVSLETIRVSDHASVQKGSPLKVTTPADQWAFAVTLPVRMPLQLAGSPYLHLRGRVLSGRVGLGVLDQKTRGFQTEKSVAPSAALLDIYVAVPPAAQVDGLVIRNAAPGNVRSEMLIESADLVLVSEPRN